MSSHLPHESRQLKRPKLGPPGYYPQDPKQKEDELTTVNVKQGFPNIPPVSHEYASAKDSNIYKNKFGVYFSAIVAEKQKLNTFQDTGKKRQPISKDNFSLVAASKARGQAQSWFYDLAGNKSLNQLAKKVPVFHRKDDIFITMCETNMPMLRAAWYLKMNAAYHAAISENKMKKRQPNDPSQDWCQHITKFLKSQLDKIVEYNNTASLVSASQSSSMNPTSSSATSAATSLGGMGSMGMGSGTMGGSAFARNTELEKCVKLWQYTTKLARYLYQEGMLECHDYLSWLVDTLEKVKSNDDSTLRFLLPFVVQYLEEFVKSQMLSRRLAYVCARRLTTMCSESRPQSPHMNTSSNVQMPSSTPPHHQNALASILAEFRSCPHHHSIILGLSCILQAITLRCPSALVWINLGESKNYSVPGSPLDILPCPPSLLPLPGNIPMQNHQIRASVRQSENQIKMRSRRAEVRWSSDKCQESAKGHTITRVLHTLEVLDCHCFDRCDASNSVDALYNKIFLSSQKQESPEPLQSDDPLVLLLCQWAVSPERTSEHRALVVAQLLEKYVIELEAEKTAETEGMEEKEMAPVSPMPTTSNTHVFQNLLQHFLDTQAPVFEESSSTDDRKAFANLVLLFGELIRCEVFSHDAYMCTLISRGDLAPSPAPVTGAFMGAPGSQRTDRGGGEKNEVKDDSEEKQDSSDNEDYGYLDDKPPPAPAPPPRKESASFQEKFLESIQSKSDSQSDISDDEKDSPMDGEKSDEEKKSEAEYRSPSPEAPRVNRHQLYALHFPIPNEDGSSYHESNQRSVLLYGFGRARTEARQHTKQVQKDLLRVLTHGGGRGEGLKGKRLSKSTEDPAVSKEGALERFHALCYFDQHIVAGSCANGVLDQVHAFTQGNRDSPPTFDQVSLVFELLENSLNINGLLDFAVKLLSQMSGVDAELTRKKSAQAGSFCTSLCLIIVAVLRRFQACLLVFPEQTAIVFELLCGVVKHVSNVTNCTSAERCILAYLYDLYTSCSHLKSKFSDLFSSVANKVKQALYTSIQPSESNLMWNQNFMQEFIENPKSREFKHSSLGRQLNDSPADRYSFVCNALLAICNASPEKLNNLSIMCAELTASCTTLSSEWLGVLKALCCSSNHSCGFNDLLCDVDVSDLSIHDNIAVFTAILIARHCFSLEDVVDHVALASIIAATPGISAMADPDAEPGARLMCHLLVRLFRTSQDTAMLSNVAAASSSSNSSQSSTSTAPGNANSSSSANPATKGDTSSTSFIMNSCDRHLLDSAHRSISVEPLVGVLKAILLLGDATVGGNSTSSLFGSFDDFGTGGSGSGRDGGSQDEGFGQGAKTAGNMSTASLSNYARYTLKTICSQGWVRETFLKDPDNLWTPEVLLDQVLSHKQIHYLLQLICYPAGTPTIGDGGLDPDQKTIITRILKNLNQWTLRVSWLELQLILKQCSPTSEGTTLDNIAKATIEVFQLTQDDDQSSSAASSSKGPSSSRRTASGPQKGASFRKSDETPSSVWLVAPLISKLSSSVQGRVLKAAGNILESVGQTWTSKASSKDKDKQGQRSQAPTVSHQPLLSLVLTCLKGQDEQREGLLSSLQTQLTQFLQSPKDDRWEDPKSRRLMHEALQLRLSLVGNMFDTIMRNNLPWTTEFALLLLQLITTGTVDPHTNNELFTTVLDMLSVLINSTLSSDASGSPGAGEEKGRTHQTLIKKLKKEVGDKHSDGINLVRQLLPVPRKTIEVITCEPMGSLIDTKGNKITGFDSIDKKQGLQVSAKQKINPWDTLEIHKNPAPLSWAWFGGIRMERKPLRYQEQYRLTLYHTHNQVKPDDHYFDPPQVPPDEEEPPPPSNQEAEKPAQELDIIQPDVKIGVASTVPPETSKEPSNKKGKKNRRKRPAPTPPQAPVNRDQQYPFNPGMPGYTDRGFVSPAMYPPGQVPFQQPLPPAGPIRPERQPMIPGSSKVALKNHLISARATVPPGQRDEGYGYGGPILKPLLTNKLLRDQITSRRSRPVIGQEGPMNPIVQPGSSQYSNYGMQMMGQQPGMSADPHGGQPQSGMVSANYNQQYSHPGGAGPGQRMMTSIGQHSNPSQMGYMPQHRQMPAARAKLQQQLQHQLSMRQPMQQGIQHAPGSAGPGGPGGPGAQPYMGHQLTQQQQQQRGQQLLQQQRLMALQQQQMQQGQMPVGSSTMMPGMQGQMGAPGRPANTMNPAHHNPYQY
ncbi:mediator of RNA polymerase II transcription subunit 12-like protein [Diadema antillarum]|uniref:mediator of RNA polymerase II transcription subunit 12-like protein n=1 Tax=Diadema antillarum TaxID=105358 RepID=UPI003A85470B